MWLLVPISYHLYFLRISKVWSKLHHGSVGRVQYKECYFMLIYTIYAFFCCFSSKKSVYIILTSSFDEVSNFGNGMLTNQKPELVIRNCQWNCMSETMSLIKIKANDCSSTHSVTIKFIDGILCEGLLMIILNKQKYESNLYLFSEINMNNRPN